MAFQWCPNFDLVPMFRALSDEHAVELTTETPQDEPTELDNVLLGVAEKEGLEGAIRLFPFRFRFVFVRLISASFAFRLAFVGFLCIDPLLLPG